MTLEDGVDRFRYKEDEDTPPHILTSGSRGVSVSKDNIATIRCKGIVVDDYNYPAP